jgi:voltage-gated potassium channel
LARAAPRSGQGGNTGSLPLVILRVILTLGMAPARKRPLKAQLLYLRALLRRFRGTFIALFLVVGGGGTLLWWLFALEGKPITFSRALLASYFLFFGQPILEIPNSVAIELVFVAIPPLALFTVVEGVVRFAYLFFARERDDKEWFTVLAQTMNDHVIIVGGGRVGFRVFEQLRKLEVPMVVIEKKPEVPFVAEMRAAGVPVLIADVRSPTTLAEANLAQARAVVCATNDDLANLNTALDARKQRPSIRVVLRLFDDDLVSKTREAFDVEAFSTSALAAPAFAVAALDPAIRNSFEVAGRLMVVAVLEAKGVLVGASVASLRDDAGALVLHLSRRTGGTLFDPRGSVQLEAGDQVTLQATLEAYRALRERMGRAA